MDYVNWWLLQNPQYIVLNAESIEKKLNKNTFVPETESTIDMEAIYGGTIMIRGIRSANSLKTF